VNGRPDPITPADIKNPVCPSSEQKAEFETKEGVDRGVYRDDIIDICMDAYDRKFNKFTAELSSGSVTTNLVGDVASGTLTTVAGVASPKAAKRLSVIAGAILGIQGAVNNDVYANKTMSALVSAMQVKRLEVLTAIVEAEKADPQGSSYTLNRAAIDLRKYEDAGTLFTGISELNKAASNAATKAASDLATAQRTPSLSVNVALRNDDANERLAQMTAKVRAIPDTVPGRAKLDAIAQKLNLKTDAGDATKLKAAYIIAELVREIGLLDVSDQPAKMDDLETKVNPLF